jgi:hypothetical protein
MKMKIIMSRQREGNGSQRDVYWQKKRETNNNNKKKNAYFSLVLSLRPRSKATMEIRLCGELLSVL